jgi:large subunit ribosomal protein L6
MSRIGKLPIKLEDKTKATVAGGIVKFEGPKGKLDVKIPNTEITISIKDGVMTVIRPSESRKHRSLHGLTRSILANAAKGVTTGWERALAIRGVGYRAEVKGKQIHFALGYSHPVVFDLPEDTLPTIDLFVRSANRELVGLVAVKIRALRPPEPYKGKGIKLSDERVRRKEGKTGTA